MLYEKFVRNATSEAFDVKRNFCSLEQQRAFLKENRNTFPGLSGSVKIFDKGTKFAFGKFQICKSSHSVH